MRTGSDPDRLGTGTVARPVNGSSHFGSIGACVIGPPHPIAKTAAASVTSARKGRGIAPNVGRIGALVITFRGRVRAATMTDQLSSDLASLRISRDEPPPSRGRIWRVLAVAGVLAAVLF